MPIWALNQFLVFSNLKWLVFQAGFEVHLARTNEAPPLRFLKFPVWAVLAECYAQCPFRLAHLFEVKALIHPLQPLLKGISCNVFKRWEYAI
jgi:hypothetical protein